MDMLLEKWIEHPLVQEAAGRAPDETMLSVFETLHEMLVELDERFPTLGLPEILATAKKPANGVIAQQLAAAGASQEDIEMICVIDRPKSALLTGEDLRAAELDMSRNEMVEAGWTTSKAKLIRSLRSDVTDEDLAIAHMVLDDDVTIALIAEVAERSRYLCRQAASKVMYRRWLGLDDQAVIR